jgi:hypothetical protein
MHHCNAVLQTCARRRQNYALTIARDVATVGLIQTAQHCGERAFAGTVLAKECVYFAWLNVEVDGVVR